MTEANEKLPLTTEVNAMLHTICNCVIVFIV